MKKTILWLLTVLLCCNFLVACNQEEAEKVTVETESVVTTQAIPTVSTTFPIETTAETYSETDIEETTIEETTMPAETESGQAEYPEENFEADLSNSAGIF